MACIPWWTFGGFCLMPFLYLWLGLWLRRNRSPEERHPR